MMISFCFDHFTQFSSLSSSHPKQDASPHACYMLALWISLLSWLPIVIACAFPFPLSHICYLRKAVSCAFILFHLGFLYFRGIYSSLYIPCVQWQYPVAPAGTMWAVTHTAIVPCLAAVVRSMWPSSLCTFTSELTVPLVQTCLFVPFPEWKDSKLTWNQQWIIKAVSGSVASGVLLCSGVLLWPWKQENAWTYLAPVLQAYWLTTYFSTFYLFCSKCEIW